ncbi:MAG: DUF4388 domain-containing protein [Chloroflexota bacterium]
MTQLQGTLAGIGLPALVRFLARLPASGRLHVSNGRWTGDLWLNEGQPVAAAFGAERGLAALDALALTLPDGRFVFSAAPPPARSDINVPPEEVLTRLDELASRQGEVAPLLAARWVVVPLDETAPEEPPLTLDRASLQALLAVSRGERTVEELARHLGLVETVQALARLRDLGLVQAEDLTLGQPAPAPTAAIHMPPSTATAEGRPAPASPARFVPSPEWQEVPPGTAVPPGGEYRMELGGKVYARWPDSDAGSPPANP